MGKNKRSSPLDEAPTPRRPLWTFTVAALALHSASGLALAGLAEGERADRARPPARITQMFEVQLEPPAPEVVQPEPAEPEPEPEPVEPEPEPPPRPRRAPPKRVRLQEEAAAEPEPTPEVPAAEAAQAADVLTQQEAEVVDFGDQMVVGSAERFAGGATAAGGTSSQAVRDPNARAGGVEGGTGKGVAPPGPSQARPARLAGAASWSDCGFPRGADRMGIDQAAVTLRVSIAPDGSVRSVAVDDDPGYGFGEHARRCALRKRWLPALDATGKPVAWSQPMKIQFVR